MRSSIRTSSTKPPRNSSRELCSSSETASAEALAAAAGAAGVGVLDGEPGALEPVLEVEDGALEQLGAGRGDAPPPAAPFLGDVVGGEVAVEEHLVAEAGASAGSDRDPQGESVVSL